MGFRAWIEEYWNNDFDAILYLLKWFKKKKIEVDSDDKDTYLKLIKKHKGNKTVQMSFETAWREYDFSTQEKEGQVVASTQEEIVEAATLHVRRYLKGPNEEGESSEPETVAVRKFLTAPARVGLKLGLTKEMGGFESARVDVNLSMPCYVEEVKDASRLVDKFVTVKLLNEFKMLQGKEDEKEEEPDLFVGDDKPEMPF